MSNFQRDDAGNLVLDDNGDPILVDTVREAIASEARAAAEAEVAAIRESAAAAVAAYREAVLAAEPTIPARLVTGETVEEIQSSIASAREIVAEIQQQQAAAKPQIGFARPGATPRDGRQEEQPRTPAEKIAAGLRERQQQR